MNRFGEQRILESWHKNALPWTSAIRRGQVESRRLVTNRAIVDAILSRSPSSVLDVGCGEGWLARELAAHGVRVTGIDVVATLIERARDAGGGEFHVASYDDVAAGRFRTLVDLVVCNFSLLGGESVDRVLAAVPDLLTENGSFIVQTVHPVVACGTLPYEDGWRAGSWDGFGSDFTDPAPWFFRTLETWRRLFVENGFDSLEIREPVHPIRNQPASVIFIAETSSHARR